MQKILQEHDIHKKISTIYCRKMNDPSLFHCDNTKLSLFLESTFNYEKEWENPQEIIKLLIKFLDALCNYNPLKSQKLSFFIYM